MRLGELAGLCLLLTPALTRGTKFHLELLSPAPLELFARSPIPLIVRVHATADGEAWEDGEGPNIHVVLDGIEAFVAPLSAPVLSLDMGTPVVGDGDGPVMHEVAVHVETHGRPVSGQVRAVFTVHGGIPADGMILHIPPMLSSRPRVLHWLVTADPHGSPGQEEEEGWGGAQLREHSHGNARPEPEAAGASTAGEARSGREWLEEYAAFHSLQMASAQARRSARYLVSRHYPTSGLGNMLQSLVSSLLLAILTRRVFLHDSLLMQELLRFPALASTNFSSVHSELGAAHIATNSQFVLYKGEEWMVCSDANDHLTEQFVFIESDQYFGGLLVNNEYYALQLKRMFGDRLFGELSSFFFRPAAHVSARVQPFIQENLRGRLSVGIHVRTHTLGHPGYIEPYALKDARGHFLNSYWKCALFAAEAETPQGSGEHTMGPIIFLAADNAAVRMEAQTVLGAQVVTFGDAITRKDMAGHVLAFIDIVLLSHADIIVTTQMSTFSYVAHALSSKVPYVVNFQGACFRDISSQPCVHAWRHIAVGASCLQHELPVDSTLETRNCGYYTRQALTAPQDCTWQE
mmetsp:Transcript_4854/g.12267  ORF Transcript_4854/g.12267 Transcript_4854/m.12267 type:complete len:576 (+) Transcript_4854:107-1834(+)